MNLDYLKDTLATRKELIPAALLGVAALCGVLILVKVTGFFVASAKAESVVKRAVSQSQADSKLVEAELAKSQPIADSLSKDNLFSPPPPKQDPIKDVFAVFGDQVLIKDRWYKVGDNVGDAKITAIGPTSVTTEWDGKTKVFYPIQAVVAEAPKSGRRPGAGPPKAGGPPQKGAEAVTVNGNQGGPDFTSRMGDAFRSMRERFASMSDAERQKFRDEMRSRAERFGFGGRGGDRGSGGGRRGSRGSGGDRRSRR
jgi:hypothetical protein